MIEEAPTRNENNVVIVSRSWKYRDRGLVFGYHWFSEVKTSMNISLNPETQRLLEERLTRGGFNNADDLVRAALESLGRREEGFLDDETLDAIDESEAQIARGEHRDWKEVSAELRRDYLGD